MQTPAVGSHGVSGVFKRRPWRRRGALIHMPFAQGLDKGVLTEGLQSLCTFLKEAETYMPSDLGIVTLPRQPPSALL